MSKSWAVTDGTWFVTGTVGMFSSAVDEALLFEEESARQRAREESEYQGEFKAKQIGDALRSEFHRAQAEYVEAERKLARLRRQLAAAQR